MFRHETSAHQNTMLQIKHTMGAYLCSGLPVSIESCIGDTRGGLRGIDTDVSGKVRPKLISLQTIIER